MKTRPLVIACALPLLATATGRAASPRLDPTPDWRCRIVFRDAGSDTIQSDQAGTYQDGAGGVTCYVVNEPGTTHHRWLFMSITGTKRDPALRYVRFIGQEFEAASYPTFQNHGTFEVKGLANVEWKPLDPTARDVMPFRAYLRHPNLPFADGLGTINGDSNVVGSFGFDGTSSVFVQPVGACSWQVTSYTNDQPDLFVGPSGERTTRTTPRVMQLTEGKDSVVRGDFPLAFQATVTIVANKPGCTSR